jgi:hypothetical protein
LLGFYPAVPSSNPGNQHYVSDEYHKQQADAKRRKDRIKKAIAMGDAESLKALLTTPEVRTPLMLPPSSQETLLELLVTINE